MQIGKNDIDRIASMSDSELRILITAAAKEKGIVLPAVGIDEVAKVRAALSMVAEMNGGKADGQDGRR